MKIRVIGDGMTPHAPLEELIEKKLPKLESFYDKIIDCVVRLKVDNASSKDNKCVEFHIAVPGDDIVVSKTSESFEESFSQCMEAAKKILVRKKEIEIK